MRKNNPVEIPGAFIIGTQVVLRVLEESDLERCYRWMNDTSMTRFLLRQLPMTRASELAWLRKERSDSDYPFAIVLKETGEHIGNCGLHGVDLLNRTATFGFFLGEEKQRGKGIGTEVAELAARFGFHTLGLNRIEACVYAFNARSRHTLEKVGYVLEGTRRLKRYSEGAFHDEWLLGLLRAEWEAQRVDTPGAA